jgi:hypothetical protein
MDKKTVFRNTGYGLRFQTLNSIRSQDPDSVSGSRKVKMSRKKEYKEGKFCYVVSCYEKPDVLLG